MRPCAGGDGLHRFALVTISNWFHGNRRTQSQSSSSWVSSMRRSENWLGGWTLTRSIPLVTESIPFAGPFILCWIGADDLEWSLYYDKKKKNHEVQSPRRWCCCFVRFCSFFSRLLIDNTIIQALSQQRIHRYLTFYDVIVWFLVKIL